MNSSKATIHKLLYLILVEIREEAHTSKNAKIFHLADLFHNIPLQIEKAGESDNYDDVMEWLINRAKEKDCEKWLENQIQYVKKFYLSD